MKPQFPKNDIITTSTPINEEMTESTIDKESLTDVAQSEVKIENTFLEPSSQTNNEQSVSTVNETDEKNETEKRIEKKIKKKIIDTDTLKAFQFFDRNQVGYIRSDDLETIFHSLGHCFSKYHVHQLISKVEILKEKKIYYKKIAEKDVEE